VRCYPLVWRADGGGKVTAAYPAAGGARNVARWLLALARRPPRSLRIATVNGGPGLVMRDANGVLTVIAFTIDAGRITALDVIRNPDKLAGVPEPG
jgi:RNA polymerase sigma-70 factor, ECF subfamily